MRPRDDRPCGTILREELMLALGDDILRAIAELPPISRLRILAFLHLLERPDALRARLDVDASGELRLTLSTARRAGSESKH
ncbi:hypothetical protein [Microvirga thermotolerans]|uniref:Uncharacterized protein n=1 Tax=Microvirga thermotolerans TaxID=2651334 RepID=A0A5P9JXQ4_9HYPH|nr:hypothetical protein [Microvirga thermotolerans]QFU17397.1 hypothetical protein GDR74_14870 [Microvirga thermotolerans]